MELFAKKLRSRASDLGLSNAEVARRAGLSERRYGNYVTGRREPDLTTLLRIAEVLQVSTDDLLRDSPLDEVSLRSRLLVATVDLPEAVLEGLVIQAEALAKRQAQRK